MKRFALIVSLLVITLAGSSQALFIGQMRSAQTLGMGSLSLSTGIGLFENSRDIYGTVRYGLAAPLDVSASLAIVDAESTDDPAFLINADLQYQFMRADMGWPLDMAFGGVFEYYKLDLGGSDFKQWSLGVNYIISRPVKLENGFAFTPYGRLNLRSDSYSWNHDAIPGLGQAASSADDSDFNIAVNLGSEFSITDKIKLAGELLIDDELGFIGGISFFMW